MNIAITFVAFVIVLTGVYFSQKNKKQVIDVVPEESEVLSETDDETGVEEATEKKVKNIQPTRKPTVTKAPTTTPLSSQVMDYQYPNSEFQSSSENSLFLISYDNTDTITNWYKEKINSLGMNIKTFVTTSANDRVLNKLVGADGQKEIRVEISKDNAGSPVQISVDIL